MSDRYIIRRERSMENKPDGEEYSASLHIWDNTNRRSVLMLPLRFKRQEIWPEEDVRSYAEAIVAHLDGESSAESQGEMERDS